MYIIYMYISLYNLYVYIYVYICIHVKCTYIYIVYHSIICRQLSIAQCVYSRCVCVSENWEHLENSHVDGTYAGKPWDFHGF